MTFETSKAGGDVNQANIATQGNVSGQSTTGVASTGPAVVDSIGGTAFMAQAAHQIVDQYFGQVNAGVAGNAGSDNTSAETSVVA